MRKIFAISGGKALILRVRNKGKHLFNIIYEYTSYFLDCTRGISSVIGDGLLFLSPDDEE